MSFVKAQRNKAFLRAAIFGPSGSGKTYSALRIASGMVKETGGKVAVIDTERGSASLYGAEFDFDVATLQDFSPQQYVQTINEAAKAGYDVLIIDSLSHAWAWILDFVDKRKSKYGGNKWSAWSDGTPIHDALVQSILTYPGHVIATMRSKTQWEVQQENGRSKPQRIGTSPIQRDGTEYEFSLVLSMSPDHVCEVAKDRTHKFQDKMIEKPGEQFGKELIDWLNEGEGDPVVEQPASTPAPITPEENNTHAGDAKELEFRRKALRKMLVNQHGKEHAIEVFKETAKKYSMDYGQPAPKDLDALNSVDELDEFLSVYNGLYEMEGK